MNDFLFSRTGEQIARLQVLWGFPMNLFLAMFCSLVLVSFLMVLLRSFLRRYSHE